MSHAWDKSAAVSALAQRARVIEAELERLLTRDSGESATLAEAMRYSLLGGGKRLRPILVLECSRSCGGADQDAMPAAVAVECVHTFSLIHDDLPAMDDDDLRRGRPTCHRVYGEAVAILAGDALLALAFEALAAGGLSAHKVVPMIHALSLATGRSGMIGGQVLDIQCRPLAPRDGESAHAAQLRTVAVIHQLKTAQLIAAACVMGGIAADASPDVILALRTYGENLGLAFQAADDVLDVTGTTERMGKKTGKDIAAGKQTLPSAAGVPAAIEQARRYSEAACAALNGLGGQVEFLKELARYSVDRVV